MAWQARAGDSSQVAHSRTTLRVFVFASGLAATVGCLLAGVMGMGSGNHKRQQNLMRGRVAAQAFTLCAFGIGFYFTKQREEAAKLAAKTKVQES